MSNLLERLEMHASLKSASPGFHLSDDDIQEILRALRNQSNEVLQEDLRDMLEALGLGYYARPQSPHKVFRECIDEVKRIKASEPTDIVKRLAIARETMDDASSLLRMYYLSRSHEGTNLDQ